ncbi:MAG: nucleoside deaminase [Humidesulfovibrio sp.]|uniref:nucleoside deaminase n=1 Tax=Humidesulfovibrio sp. TaxID=2910988 RepID=UPI0027FE1313|nr:nucleoside deaminase [Humidesulfovibrio sp.]MDQ7834520.1 nucleoside deaminase [Humidesulfovibrio sp.]
MNRSVPPERPPGYDSWRALMSLAFDEACLAAQHDEAPVGAVLLAADGSILAKAHNSNIALKDPTAHAEVLCLREAGQKLGNHRLTGSILAVTLEPCLMCVGALVHARVAGVVFAAADPKAGALVSNLDARTLPFLNHRPWVLQGVMAEECGAMLKRFFLARRKPG